MAIVLVIIGVLLGGLVIPLSTQQDVEKLRTVTRQLDEIREALLGYAANAGRLPCPATTASAGLADPAGATVACTVWHGYVPVRSLGLDGAVDANGLLLDPWLHPIRYSLSASPGGAYSNAIVLGLLPDLEICADSACATVYADNAAAVIFSLGEDGTGTASADQLENLDGDPIFVTRTLSEAPGDEFDDHLVWLSPNTVAYHLVRAGRME